MGYVYETKHLETPNASPIPVSIKKSPNRKTWSLSVSPGGLVELSVPLQTTNDKVNELLSKHSPWIFKRFKKLSKIPRIELSQKWIDGESYYYNGKSHTLQLKRSNYSRVEIDNFSLNVFSSDFRAAFIKKVVENWVEEQTLSYSKKFIQKWTPRFNLSCEPNFKLRLLKRSWGQCRSDKVITLHKFLSRLHADFFEYVVVHEMCHLFHMNHGPGFKALLSHHLPHWKEIKKQHEPILF